MENLWGDLDNLEAISSPTEILEEQANYLNSATKGSVYAILKESDHYYLEEEEEYSFCFNFILRSKYASNYKFNILEITYPISFYPLTILTPLSIGKYIKDKITKLNVSTRIVNSNSDFEITGINTEDDLKIVLEAIFKSQQMRDVIRALISLK